MASEGLAVLNQDGSRGRVIPAEAYGPLQRRRLKIHFALMLVFLVLPWIQFNGMQALLLDIPGRRFEIFGVLFLAHDAPLIFLVLLSLALSLALVTAVWGRVWCGWACPQTVFIDFVYRNIERFVEGSYLQRRQLAAAPLSAIKLRLFVTKWFLFAAVSSLFAHSFAAYFVGSRRLMSMMSGNPNENVEYFLMISAITALLLFNFGWFREQFCLIMCPYGRLQGVLIDQGSLVIAYDSVRGEPRKSPLQDKSRQGDCVSCNRCVEVCPTKIDIRDGLQMECISCTACVDACNLIMSKVGKQPDLIGYRRAVKKSVYSPRALAYGFLITVCVSILFASIAFRDPFNISVVRAIDTPYQNLPGGLVLNHFKVHLFNQSHARQKFALSLTREAEEKGVRLQQSVGSEAVDSGKSAELHIFIVFPKELLKSASTLSEDLLFQELLGATEYKSKITLIGPQT